MSGRCSCGFSLQSGDRRAEQPCRLIGEGLFEAIERTSAEARQDQVLRGEVLGSTGLNASLAGIIVPNLANAFGIFLMRQFISGVPDELIDAARMDGASELLILYKIVAPSVAPAIAALALFAFVYHWNSYLWPLTVLQGNADAYPIVISLSRLLSYNRGAVNTGLVMAGATLAVLPPLILFVLLQRFFVDSIVGSAIKG
ncbi:carbohydrate ABC transporter permease [Mesorhizobium sp. B2-3-14]|uniref:carbohydrate ABC transporter permease n=1 Tax=Mesorhizobium sp. B2-3-14 TaxID=2589950 RepID=UPI001FEED310|nr:carbohydrate ABC transporter permease [Mesorhizobium sp. B2-3-14]